MDKKRRKQRDEKVALTKPEKATLDKCVKHFEANAHLFQNAADAVMSVCTNDPDFKEFIHFIKSRVKDPKHLPVDRPGHAGYGILTPVVGEPARPGGSTSLEDLVREPREGDPQQGVEVPMRAEGVALPRRGPS